MEKAGKTDPTRPETRNPFPGERVADSISATKRKTSNILDRGKKAHAHRRIRRNEYPGGNSKKTKAWISPCLEGGNCAAERGENNKTPHNQARNLKIQKSATNPHSSGNATND